mgnify:CR=1 FL=1
MKTRMAFLVNRPDGVILHPQTPTIAIFPFNEFIRRVEIGNFHIRTIPKQDFVSSRVIIPFAVGFGLPIIIASDGKISHQNRLG